MQEHEGDERNCWIFAVQSAETGRAMGSHDVPGKLVVV